MLVSPTIHRSIASTQSIRPNVSSSIASGISPQYIGRSQNLRTSTQAAALPDIFPEISPEMLTQAAAVGRAARMLAFAGFTMIAIDQSTSYIAKKTDNDMVNTIATTIAAILLGGFIRNEIADTQAVFSQTKSLQAANDFSKQETSKQETPSQDLQTKTVKNTNPVSWSMTDFPVHLNTMEQP